ncbi:MAG: undecaprenyl-phosphate glucose phosphotransferase [Chloroflexi bacterium]|nr:undecaprenyl-phosphate glucose phosphotransferase [Chloroflexota bacterium]MCL5274089.1 undecaprenyl-phosphate glucose phosphotransferase [Chloroflexota bacterium]
MQEALAQAAGTHTPFLKRHYHNVVTLSLLMADVFSIALAFAIGFELRILIPLPERAADNLDFGELLPLLVMQVIFVVVAFFFGRMYHRQRTRYSSTELAAIFSGVSIGTLMNIAVTSLTFKSSSGAFDYSRGVMIYAWLLSIIFVVFIRGAQGQLQRWMQSRGYGRTRVVVVGAGETASALMQRILQTPRLGYDLVGLVNTNGDGLPQGVRLLGDLERLSDVIGREAVDEVIVATPEAKDTDLIRIISKCDRSTISIKVYPDLFQIMAGQMSISELGGLPLLNVRDIALRGWKLVLKRGIDLFGSVVGLVFLSPLMMFVALLIKLDSPGPVFLVQERMGLDGKRFNVFKFRSMRADAERDGPGWTVKGDPRVTRLGRIMRKTNIDELPQFINVLIGEMSLVGPRPERPVYVEEFRKRIPRYMERHREKAGMTGWAQVNGLRGDSSIEDRTKYDLWYIENWSAWLDIKIILQTVWLTIVRQGENAY